MGAMRPEEAPSFFQDGTAVGLGASGNRESSMVGNRVASRSGIEVKLH